MLLLILFSLAMSVPLRVAVVAAAEAAVAGVMTSAYAAPGLAESVGSAEYIKDINTCQQQQDLSRPSKNRFQPTVIPQSRPRPCIHGWLGWLHLACLDHSWHIAPLK